MEERQWAGNPDHGLGREKGVERYSERERVEID